MRNWYIKVENEIPNCHCNYCRWPLHYITLPCSDTELSFGLEVLISHSPTSAYQEFDIGWSCFFTFLFGVSKNIRHKFLEQNHSYEQTLCFSSWSLVHSSTTAQHCAPAILMEMIKQGSLWKQYWIKYTRHINRYKLRHTSTFLQNTSENSTLWNSVPSKDSWITLEGKR
jgi:hypothetical protein